MRFGPVPVRDAVGAIVAHAVRQDGVVLKKGVRVQRDDVERLAAAGVESLVVARLDAGDLSEDEAAYNLATCLAGAGVRLDAPFTGRTNLFAEAAGVLLVDGPAVDRANALDEAVTVATLPALKAVEAGEMVATVKIIPFAVSGALAARACEALGAGAVRIAPFQPKRIGVISTVLPGLKPSVVTKTADILADRLRPAGATIVAHEQCGHAQRALEAALSAMLRTTVDIVVVFGASAITDRRDVIPAALEAVGGRIEHFGMPVDPGNLLLLGAYEERPVLGAPGCARSPKENGFDWVLQRLLADVPVTRAEIQSMGVGGLLMEIVSRGQPRAQRRR